MRLGAFLEWVQAWLAGRREGRGVGRRYRRGQMTEDASLEQSTPRTDHSPPPAPDDGPTVDAVAASQENVVGPKVEAPAAAEPAPSPPAGDAETSAAPPPTIDRAALAEADGQWPEPEWVAEVEEPRWSDDATVTGIEATAVEVSEVVDGAGTPDEPVVDEPVHWGGDASTPAPVADDVGGAPGPEGAILVDHDRSEPTTEDPPAAGPSDATTGESGPDDGSPADAPDDHPVAGEHDYLTLDGIAMALGSEPPIPAELPPEAPADAPAGGAVAAEIDEPAVEWSAEAGAEVAKPADHVPPADDGPTVAEEPAEWPADPDDVVAAQAAAKAEADEVADFWYPPIIVDDARAALDEAAARGEPAAASLWSAEEKADVIGVRGVSADWTQAEALPPPDSQDPRAEARVPDPRAQDGVVADALAHADWVDGGWVDGGWVDGGWVDDDRPARGWRRLVGPLAGRWSTMGTGERVNVVLYALTGLSVIAMGLELLAGPDDPSSEVSTRPNPVVSTTTVRQSTTITFPTPKAPEEPARETGPAPAPQRPVAGADRPVQVAPTAPAGTAPAPVVEPQPEPEPDPISPPPQTTPPATSPPATQPTTPTSSSGFPEPTPPILPVFP